jgi:hypothetical protein
VQVEVAKQKGGVGFLFWNANNDYSKPYAAMPEMRAANAKDKDRFFRGDEIGAKAEAGVASVAPAAIPAAVNTGNTQSAVSGGSHKPPTIYRH